MSVLISASKFHGYGNDFLIAPAEQLSGLDCAAFAKAICDPHFGVGADGCVLIYGRQDQAFFVRIFNQDGSETGMSGNGARCACAFMHQQRWTEACEVLIQTTSGPKIYTLIEERDQAWLYRSRMGEPRFASADVPFAVEPPRDSVRDFPVQVGDETLTVTALWVGNPQCVVFVSDRLNEETFLRWGAALERHRRFPERTNVSFVQVTGPNEISIQIYERGVGPTLSSGTGSCGAALASLLTGKVSSPVLVRTQTGAQTVEWRPGQEILLTGWAEYIGRIEFLWRHRD
jgi:diaminopimelate epimerase